MATNSTNYCTPRVQPEVKVTGREAWAWLYRLGLACERRGRLLVTFTL